MAFDPKAHLIQLPRRVKDQQTGQWVTRLDEYLEVKWRLCWFRDRYPHGSITTEVHTIDWDKGLAIFRAWVVDGEGGQATGTATETRKGFEDFVEKAETRAIGRALAMLGLGTQFVWEELSEGDHVADAPVAPNGHEPKAEPPSPVVGEGEHPMQAPPDVHPTADEIPRLVECALAANHSMEAFGQDMRRLMNLPETQKITKKFLRERMTMAQYEQARKHYGQTLAEILNQDVPDYQPPPSVTEIQPSSEESVEALVTADVTGVTPPRHAADDPAERDRAIVRELALGWGLPEHEVDHILTHHRDPQKARDILWKARQQREHKPDPQRSLAEAAAD